MRWLSLLLWLTLCLGTGGAGALFTAPEILGWYRKLRKPAFNPPDRVFSPVWTALYILMAIAAWLVAGSPPAPARTAALGLFMFQLALNLAWSWLFFRQHAVKVAAVELLVLWVAIGATVFVFSLCSVPAAWYLVPYWGWCTFAAIVNLSLLKLNPSV